MAINPLIALQGKTVDPLGSAGRGLALRESIQSAPLRNNLLQSQVEQASLNNQLLQGRVDQQPMQNRLLGSQVSNAEERARQVIESGELASIAEGALRLKGFLDGGNIEGARNFLLSRQRRLSELNRNPQETNEALSQLDAGDIDGLKGNIDNILSASMQMGILGGNDSRFQRGAGAIVSTDDGSAFATPVFDPRTGAQRVEVSPIPGTLASRTGETPEQSTQREVKETREKERAKSSIKAANDAFKAIGSIQTSIVNINEAINAIDDGASTGVISSRLPSIRAASIKLDNLRNQLGLDVVGATAFGALSESELALALDTALPTKLPPQELRAWLEQKRDAQQRTISSLQEAAVFLSQGGNIDELIEQRQSQQQQPQQQSIQVLHFDSQGNLKQ